VRKGRTLQWREAITADLSSLTVVTHDGALEYTTFDQYGFRFEASADTGIDQVGGLAVLDATTLDAVVSGQTAGVGEVVLVAQQGQSLSVTQLYTEVGADFGGVAHSAKRKRLYVYDTAVGRILWTPYSVGQTSIGAWTLLADANTVPALGLPRVQATSRLHVEDGPSPTLILTSDDWWDDTIPTVKIKDTSGAATATIVDPPAADPALKIRSHMAPGATTVEVTGPSGAPFEVVREDVAPPLVVGSGVIDTTGAVAITTSPLAWGGIYAARSPGGAAQPPFDSPSLLFGEPDTTPIGNLRSLRSMFPAHAAFLGHDHFQIPVRIDVDPTTVTPPVVYSAVLTVGVLGVSSIIPWASAQNPNRVVLAGIVDFPGGVHYDDESIPPIGTVKIPLPGDPSMAGAVLLFQWLVVFGPTDIRVSDVIGYMIRDTVWVPPSSAWLLQPVGTPPGFSFGEAAGPATRPTEAASTAVQEKPSEACLRALRDCLLSLGAVPLTDAALGERLRQLGR
jgi:hypothetical protein